MKNFWKQNFYELLEIEPNSSQKDIQRAYKRAKLTYGSGSMATYSLFSEEEAKQIMEKIEQAYHVLSNTERRERYDRNHGFNVTKLPMGEAPPRILPEEEKEDDKDIYIVKDVESEDFRAPVHLRDKPEIQKEEFTPNPEFEKKIHEREIITGEWLKTIREYRRIKLEEISRRTRISVHYLELIESDNYEKLPAEVYLKGFLRQLAVALGLNPDKIRKGYLESVQKAGVKLRTGL